MHIYLIEIYLPVIEDFNLTLPKLFNLINSHVVFLLDFPSKSSTVSFVPRFSTLQGQLDISAFQ